MLCSWLQQKLRVTQEKNDKFIEKKKLRQFPRKKNHLFY